MPIKITDETVRKYLKAVSEESKDSFLALAKRMGEPSDSLEGFVRSLLEFLYGEKAEVRLVDSVAEKYREKSYNELINLLKAVDCASSWEILGPQDPGFVREVLDGLEYRLPNSLIMYLIQVGGMELGDYYMPSIAKGYRGPTNTLASHTNQLMKDYSLPSGYFCLDYSHEGHQSACLDLAMMENDECPVLLYDKDKRRFEGQVAINFDFWFRDKISIFIDALERANAL